MTTLRALLNPGYEPDDGSADGAQLVDEQWWHPCFGCDSLQYVVDNARQALAPEVAIPAEQYHEDDGPVLWWLLPVMDAEGAWAGTPNDSDWPGYHTHYTRLPPAPVAPTCTPESEAL